MPIVVTTTAGFATYSSPFIGRVDETVHVKVDVSALTTDMVDDKGYLKGGVFLKTGAGNLGVPLDGTVGERVEYVTVEPIKIASGNAALSSDTSDPFVACAVTGTINRDIAEDNLGRAYNANELAGCKGSRFTLTLT